MIKQGEDMRDTGNTSASARTSPRTRRLNCPNCGRTNRVPEASDGRPRCGNCRTSLPWIAEADDRTFVETADRASLPVLVDLWAPWCGPCRRISPVLEEVAKELAGRIKLVKVNVDNSPGIAERFTVQAVPTLLILNRGEVVARQAGAAPSDILRDWVEKAIARTTGPG
jgi:thioredoxin 2